VIHLLNSRGRTRVVRVDSELVKLVVGRPRRPKPARDRANRPGGAQGPSRRLVRGRLRKRLLVVLRTMLLVLDSFGEIPLSADCARSC